MSFPQEGYFAKKIIAYGEEMYADFLHQSRGPVNVTYHDNSIVLPYQGVDIEYETLVIVIQLLFVTHILFYRWNPLKIKALSHMLTYAHHQLLHVKYFQ